MSISYYDKLCDLLDELRNDPSKFNSFETEFIEYFTDTSNTDIQINFTLSDAQEVKIDELYEKHMESEK